MSDKDKVLAAYYQERARVGFNAFYEMIKREIEADKKRAKTLN